MKVTKAQFSTFKRECERCIKEWKITGWDIHIGMTELDGKNATCTTQVLSRIARIALTNQWHDDKPLTRAELVRLARHEMTHLLLSPLADVVSSRYLTEDEEKHANESVCNHVESLLP